ncbi:MAG: threonine--tRNA ligase, partial [bacterium]|nr:threonine--tRNA ligase [bacterium]
MKLKILNLNQELEVEKGSSYLDLLSKISDPDKDSYVGVKFNGEIQYWYGEITDSGEVRFIKDSEEEGLEILRHSASHVMAGAIQNLYPGVKFAIGPAIAEGFYYDLDLNEKISENDFDKIEKEMQKIIDKDYPLKRESWDKEKAKKYFQEKSEKFKIELIEGIPDENVSIFTDGDFLDLCRGPHIPSTGKIKAFKLLSVAGAYWRGSEKNPMLTRVYGTAFPSKEELENYIQRLAEAEKRDHRRLGKELELFNIYEEAGGGLVFWLPNGALIRKIIEDFWREKHLDNGYELVYSPHVAKSDLWETSGHLGFYKENMYDC